MFFLFRNGRLFDAAEDGGSGGGNGGGDLSDTAMKAIAALVNTTVNNAIGGFKKDLDKSWGSKFTTLEETIGKLTKQGDGDNSDGGSGDDGKQKVDPATNARLLDLTKKFDNAMKQIERMAEEKKQADTKADIAERKAAFAAAIQALPAFRDDELREAFAARYFPQIQRTEDGQLVLNDLPVDKALKAIADQKPAYFAASDKGGSGARGGQPPASKGRIHVEDIKPGMSQDAQQQAANEILAAMRTQA